MKANERRAAVGLLEEAFAYFEARAELEKCLASCEYDAGYFCALDRDAVERAESRFVEAFRSAIAAFQPAPLPHVQGQGNEAPNAEAGHE